MSFKKRLTPNNNRWEEIPITLKRQLLKSTDNNLKEHALPNNVKKPPPHSFSSIGNLRSTHWKQVHGGLSHTTKVLRLRALPA